jgi:hypothetical protein
MQGVKQVGYTFELRNKVENAELMKGQSISFATFV